MDTKEAFDRAADEYDLYRRQLIPCFDAFYGTAIDLLAPFRSEGLHVLDLGAGTGLLADLIMRSFPHARIDLLDASEEMLIRAQARFEGKTIIGFRVGDYRTEPLGGPYDAVVSALSIHHLQDLEKQTLFAAVKEALRPGGIFINADNVCAEDPAVQTLHRSAWIEKVRASGLGEDALADALERTKLDVLAPLETQLEWLRQLGFKEVGSFYTWHHFAVFAGRRA